MDYEQIQQNISIINDMIEKTKKETADSGYFFIGIGLLTMVFVFVIAVLEFNNMGHLVIPALLVLLFAGGIMGYFTVNPQINAGRVKSYFKTLCYSVWFACSVPVFLITFLLPALKVISYSQIPVFTTLIFGIAIFVTGVIFGSRYIYWSSLIWWLGALVLAFVQGYSKTISMEIIILFGWVLPGIILNRQYRKYGARKNES